MIARLLLSALTLFAGTFSRPLHATAELVSPPPAELDELTNALTSTLDALRREAWPEAERAARASSAAWARLRDGPHARTLSSALVWQLDGIGSSLQPTLVRKDARRLAKTANDGLRLTLAVRRHFRAEQDLAIESFRIELRELAFFADRNEWQKAERARKRAIFRWQRLRDPVEARARTAKFRLRPIGTYYDICFDELERAVRERDRIRLGRAARSALELTEILLGRGDP